ncbi:tetraacyldisaccharide 4'-kinase [Marinomonas dokdonensis]|uniref:tetraacyldisaccharide 4'-kinase n=1 Tax=Marinomonas dokdonensis TaxID=328224 RepID=UPI0040558F8D
MSLENAFNRSWYQEKGWTQLFKPLLPLVNRVVAKKRNNFLLNKAASYRAPIPIIVVGNISVGGTGKSPMVVALCELLKTQGYKPGIVSRGHGAKVSSPVEVSSNSLPAQVGDEPVMLAKRTQCPLVVFPKRDEAVKHLLSNAQVDVIISDDGMQHYALQRDIEIAMLDNQRGLGNGSLLPVGPLREPASRLLEVDFVVTIGEQVSAVLDKLSLPIHAMPLQTDYLYQLQGDERRPAKQLLAEHSQWHLMAGIGNPLRFQHSLQALGLPAGFTHQWFTDHHAFVGQDIPTNLPVIMTEKDAVKCQYLKTSNSNIWYLPISLQLTEEFATVLLDKLNRINLELQNHE